MDARAIEKELSAAFQADHKRKAEDEMKKRAILSARSYDEFRHLVAAATLKPMERDDFAKKLELAPNRALSSLTGSATHRASDAIGFAVPTSLADPSAVTAAAAASAVSASKGSSASGPSLPTTTAEFERTWRRLPKDAATRGRFLCQCGDALLLSLLGSDMDGDRLLDFARALAAALAADAPSGADASASSSETAAVNVGGADAATAVQILACLAQSGGFDLCLALLTDADKRDAIAPILDIAAKDTTGTVDQAMVSKVRAEYAL
jgi:hypothetical protein